MRRRFRNKLVLGAAALAAAAFAGGAYAATQSGSGSRQAFINDVAHRLNVTPTQLTAAMRAALIDRINQAVKDGKLTQARANMLEQRINEGKLPLAFGPRAHRGLRAGIRRGLLNTAARYLGLTDTQLRHQLRSGKTLAQVASSQGKTTAGLEQALTTAFKSRLDRAVSAGKITSKQEQNVLSHFESWLGRRVNRPFTRAGRSPARTP